MNTPTKYTLAALITATVSAILYRFSGSVAGAWDWSIRLAIVALAALVCAVSPGVRGAVADTGAWLFKPSAPVPTVRNTNFDALRLYLAISVAVMHCCAFENWHPWYIKPFLLLPHVPCFVCLSGFLIPHSFTISRNLGHFAWKRFLRVFPCFLMSILLVCILFGTREIHDIMIDYLSFGMIAVGVNGVLWSLMTEEACYAWHSLSRVSGIRWTVRTAWVSFVACFSVWLCFHFDGSVYTFGSGEDRIMAAFSAFFAGNILSFYADRLPSPGKIFGMALAVFILGTYIPDPLRVTIISVAVIALMQQSPRIRFWKLDLSYGCYVFHVPILIYLIRLGFTPTRTLLTGLSITLLMAALSCILVESRCMKAKNVVLGMKRNRDDKFFFAPWARPRI